MVTTFTQKSPPLRTRFLAAKNIPAFLELQDISIKALPPECQHHLKPKSTQDLHLHINNRMPLMGKFNAHGKLAAQLLLTFPQFVGDLKMLEGYPVDDDTQTTAVIQSLSVHPARKGNGLGPSLIEDAFNVALQRGCVQVIAKVAKDNRDSFRTFTKAGFTPWQSGVDPQKGYPVWYMRKAL